jgi:tRNA1(Val) A37 N6-methylase TrmN6
MIVFAELKTQRGKITAGQEEWLTALRACGQMAFVWRPDQMQEICELLYGTHLHPVF